VRVVCDTNVVVSSFLNPYGASAKIVGLFLESKLRFCYDARILAEYEEVLSRPKFRIPAARIRRVLDVVRLDGEMISDKGLSVKLADPDDQPFLEVAVAAQAECLITGNSDDFKPVRSTEVLVFAPARFLDRYRSFFE
jgi:putative PIN family toxin of toxin-antitoxin system